MPRIYFWSRAELRNGIEDWKKITPPPVRKAVEALRKKFEEQAWKVGEIMRQGCHPALHKGMGDQARMISRGIERLGYSALPTVDEGQTETTVFTSYFYRCADLLAKEVRRTFLELLEISQVQSSVIDREPIDWAALQIRGLVADESCRIPLWTKNACDKQPYGPTANSDDVMCWKRWRAPKWFCMEPFADPPYDRAIAWQRMDETESKHVLLVVEDRFNQRLIRELDDAVGVAHVRLAKRANLPNLQAADKHSNLPDTRENSEGVVSFSNLWRDFHDKFQALANEEARIVRATRKDSLFADCEFTEHEIDPLPKGPCCLLPTMESAVRLELREGPDEHLKAQFEVLATRAAKALGCGGEVPPLKFWLCNLFLHLQRTKSQHLFAPTHYVRIDENPESDLLKPLAGQTLYVAGGIITNVCVASAILCSRLEKRALETLECAPAVAQEKTVVGVQWFDSSPDTVRRRQLALKNPRMRSKSLCNVFDNVAPPIPLPRDWRAELGVDTWSKAYENKVGRNRIQKIIGTDRKAGRSSSS